jgi:hypothetical protein
MMLGSTSQPALCVVVAGTLNRRINGTRTLATPRRVPTSSLDPAFCGMRRVPVALIVRSTAHSSLPRRQSARSRYVTVPLKYVEDARRTPTGT